MLEFNPNDRYAAEECLNSKVFDKIRNKQLEEPAQGTVRLKIDDE